MRARHVAPLVLAVALAGCSGAGTQHASRPSPSPAPSVAVTTDLAFATSAPQGWTPPLLDVYRPSNRHGAPLVVLLHGAGLTKASLVLVAEAVAEQGAVAVVPNWGGPETAPPAAAAIRLLRDTARRAACAVSYAVTRAREWGADPGRLVLFGHSGGANTAAAVAYGAPGPYPGCAVATASWQPRGLLLWDGDWLLESPDWDVFATALPVVMREVTPWHLLSRAPRVPVELAVTDTSRLGFSRCEDLTPGWLKLRDPDGTLGRQLAARGALRDGCVDVGEASDLLGEALRAHHVPATALALSDPESRHEHLADDDIALLGRHLVALAGG